MKINVINANIEKQYKLALELVTKMFEDIVDKAGVPYIEHLKTVSENTKTQKGKVIGLLHDIIEDTPITEKDLKDLNFDDDIVNAVILLTKTKGVNYNDYIQKLSENLYASDVKIADMTHNSELSRLNNITNKDIKRSEKYQKNIIFLKEKWKDTL